LDTTLVSQEQSKLEGQNEGLLPISESFTENKIIQQELGSLESKSNQIIVDISEEDKNSEKPTNNELLEEVFNSYLYIKFGFLNKKIKEKKIIEYFNDEEEKENENKEKEFGKYFKECIQKPLDDILLINKGKKLKIFDNKSNNILEHKTSKINIIKITKDKAYNLLRDSVNVQYYLLQIKKGKKEKNEYYLFKIGIKYFKVFDDAIKSNIIKLIIMQNFKFLLKTKNAKGQKSPKRSQKKSIKKEKEKKKEKEINDSYNEKSEKEINQKDKESSKDEESKKSEEKPKNQPQDNIRSFKNLESSSDKNTDKEKASILDDDDSSEDEKSPGEVGKVIKNHNVKNASKYQNEHKSYDFIVNGKKSSIEISKGKLRVHPYNESVMKVPLNEITPSKVTEDKENSGYKLEIKKGRKIIFNVFNEDKNVLNNFYHDLNENK
jgi:hypothetical protein